jgi:tetratricopeptide (TPR) repeat protein
LGLLAVTQEDYDLARRFFEQSLRWYEELDDAEPVSNARNDLAEVARIVGDYERAAELYAQNQPVAATEGEKLSGHEGYGVQLHNMGQIALLRGDSQRAAEFFREGLHHALQVKREIRVIEFLAALAEVAAAQSNFVRAAHLIGAVETLLRSKELRLEEADRTSFDRAVNLTKSQLDAEAYEGASLEGGACTLERAVEYALAP